MKSRSHRGRFVLLNGSMFSGKTERLIAWARRMESDGLTVRAFKHRIDDRYDKTHLVTHTRVLFPATPVASAEDIPDHCADAACVVVDEGQFFGPEIVETVRALRDRGHSIMIAGISNDAWGRPFSPMPELALLADAVETCRSPCTVCGDPAEFNQRLVPVTTPTMIGGPAEYEARCPVHFTPLTDSARPSIPQRPVPRTPSGSWSPA